MPDMTFVQQKRLLFQQDQDTQSTLEFQLRCRLAMLLWYIREVAWLQSTA
jgi:hypothetical protein